jgi:formylglycine-generating enzyme required for sulfatase activity
MILMGCIVVLAWTGSPANNIAVANVSLADQNALSNYVSVEFDLSWENSWRAVVVPGNRDAAWVFVKYRVSGGEWHHATLDTAVSAHLAPSGSEIRPATDSKGAFICRSSTGNGTNAWSNVRLRWNYGTDGIADDALLEVKVFAVEMVYIPAEPCWLGDGNGTTESTLAIHGYSADNQAILYDQAILVRSDFGTYEDSYITGAGGDSLMLLANNGVSTTGGTSNQYNPLFPTGKSSFYIMKYEISQEQYKDFLNCLTRTQQGARVSTNISGTSVTNRFVMSGVPTMQYRQSIRCDATIPAAPAPVTFYCDYDSDGTGNESNDGQNIACNYLTWMDEAAYYDWAGLRPMTEPEFELACRGPNAPVSLEFAWGSVSTYMTYYTLSNAGSPNETIANMGVSTGNGLHSGTASPTLGPVRCGIFAASSSNHTRVETGATYYGVMEMSGNLSERVVHLGSVAGRSFTGLHGNGELNAGGAADVDYWPGINGNSTSATANGMYGGTTGVTAAAGIGFRGGNWVNGYNFSRLSDRSLAGTPATWMNHENMYGSRGIRTAP